MRDCPRCGRYCTCRTLKINGPVMCVNHQKRVAVDIVNDRGLCRECLNADRAATADAIVRELAECALTKSDADDYPSLAAAIECARQYVRASSTPEGREP